MRPRLCLLSFAPLILLVSTTVLGAPPPGRTIFIEDTPSTAGFLSPPNVIRPYYLCSSVVGISGALPQATIELEGEINGNPVHLTETASWFGTATFQLPMPIETTQDWFRARQSDGTDQSVYDADAADPTIRATIAPEPAMTPRVYWQPHYACGVRAGVTTFPSGAEVWLVGHTTSMPVREHFRAQDVAFHAVEGVGPAYVEGEQLEAHYEFCKAGEFERVAVSERVVVSPYPKRTKHGDPTVWEPIPPPVPSLVIVEGSPIARVGNLWHGATVEVLKLNGGAVGTGATASPSAGILIDHIPTTGDYYARQSFPGCHGGTDGPPISVTPCVDIPAPEIRRPAPGDEHVDVTSRFPGGYVTVFAADGPTGPMHFPPLGRGASDRIQLSRALDPLEHLIVTQSVGPCTSNQAFTIQVDCAANEQGELRLLELRTHRQRRTGGQTLTCTGCR